MTPDPGRKRMEPPPASRRDAVLAIFEKHRIAPGTPFDEDHFLDFLLPHPKGKRAVYNSFRGLRRFNAFIDEVQFEFAICFSMEDRDANYPLDRFVDRVNELETSRRSSLASLRSQTRAATEWNVAIVANLVLFAAAAALKNHAWVLALIALAAVLFNSWFLWLSARAKRYHAKLLAKIEGKEQTA